MNGSYGTNTAFLIRISALALTYVAAILSTIKCVERQPAETCLPARSPGGKARRHCSLSHSCFRLVEVLAAVEFLIVP
jgi:hypothetical protein